MYIKQTTTILTLIVFFISGCGSSIETVGSRTLSSTDGSKECKTKRVVNEIATDCSGFDNNGFKGDVATYYDPLTQQARYNLIRVQFRHLPNTVSDDNYQLEFFGWSEDCQGERSLQTVSKGIYVQHKATGQFYREEGSTVNVTSATSLKYLNSSIRETVATAFGENANEFYGKFYIIVNNLADTDQAIYMGAFPVSGGKAVSWGNFLLTPHFVNPRVYEDTHYGDLLINLHPFINSSENKSSAEYYEDSKLFCENMKVM